MNKVIAVTATAVLAATCLCGCSKSTKNATEPVQQPSEPQQVQTRQSNTDNDEKSKIEIIFDGNKEDGFHGEIIRRGALPGTRRHFVPDRSGSYTVEYVHAPYGIDKDETLDYKLTLNDDNTFDLTVVSDGVTANHNGRWYERRSEIMLFYDEQMDPQQHNVYVADSLFGELLPKGKIMIYDNCYTIVLAKQDQTSET